MLNPSASSGMSPLTVRTFVKSKTGLPFLFSLPVSTGVATIMSVGS